MTGIIREASLEGSGGTEAGTFRKASEGGKGLLEPSLRQGAKGEWKFQVAQTPYWVHFHTHPLCAQPGYSPSPTLPV